MTITSCEDCYVETKERIQFINITELLQEVIAKHHFSEGILNVYNMHTTSGLWINEKESGLLEDMKAKMNEFADEDNYYRHDDLSIRTENLAENGAERKNAHAHLRSSFFHTNVCLNVKDSRIELGKWQSVIYVELDGPQKRRLQVMMLGKFNR